MLLKQISLEDYIDENYQQSEEESTNLKPGDMIQDRFRLGDLIGEGSFGQVFKVYDTQHNNELMAIKIEQDDEEQDSMLEREIKVMMELKKKTGFPQIKYYGQENHYTYYMMNLLGPNLEATNKKCGGTFSMTTTLKIAIQILTRIETFHNLRLIHRDIKPDNFALGLGPQQSIIHLIDFGLSKIYISSKGDHIKYAKKRGLIGTARYASLNAHNEMEQSRRDDLESIAYLLIYLCTGTLPWMNLNIDKKDLKYAKIYAIKKQQTPEMLCKNLPSCFCHFLTQVKKLDFTSNPNYSDYRKHFQNELDLNHQNHMFFDWEKLLESQSKRKNLTLNIRNREKEEEKMKEMPKQPTKQQTIQDDQFDKFEQFLQNKKQPNKFKRSNSPASKKKQPIIINVIEQDEIYHKSGLQALQSKQIEQAPFSPPPIIKSCNFLEPPTTPVHQDQISNGGTSVQNNYEWSEQEILSEGKPIWDKGNNNQTNVKLRILKGIVPILNKKRHSRTVRPFGLLSYPQKNTVTSDQEAVQDIE